MPHRHSGESRAPVRSACWSKAVWKEVVEPEPSPPMMFSDRAGRAVKAGGGKPLGQAAFSLRRRSAGRQNSPAALAGAYPSRMAGAYPLPGRMPGRHVQVQSRPVGPTCRAASAFSAERRTPYRAQRARASPATKITARMHSRRSHTRRFSSIGTPCAGLGLGHRGERRMRPRAKAALAMISNANLARFDKLVCPTTAVTKASASSTTSTAQASRGIMAGPGGPGGAA